MSVAQAEYNAYKLDIENRFKILESVVHELQEETASISVQAAPWSASIETAVAASEAKAVAALTEVRSLYEGTKAEVEDLRKRATEV